MKTPEPLGNVIHDVTNGLYKPASQYGAGTRIVRINDFTNGTLLEEPLSLQRLTVDDEDIEKFGICENDILLNRVNSLEHVGKVAFVGNLSENTVYESNMMRLRVNLEKARPLYVFFALTTQPVIEQLRRKSKRAIGQVSVNQQDVRSILISVPSLREQDRILRQAEGEVSLCLGLKRNIDRYQHEIKRITADCWAEL